MIQLKAAITGFLANPDRVIRTVAATLIVTICVATWIVLVLGDVI